MIPEPAILLRCNRTIDHAKLSMIIAKAVEQDQPYVPLLRPLLVSDIALVMPSYNQPVPLTEGKDPEDPTIVHLQAFGIHASPVHWISCDGLLRWATFIIMFGEKAALHEDRNVREFAYNAAVLATALHKRVLIVRSSDNGLKDWEEVARFYNPGVPISLRPAPHMITAEGSVPMAEANLLEALRIPPA